MIEHAGLGDVHDSSSMSLLGSGILCFLIMYNYHTYAYEYDCSSFEIYYFILQLLDAEILRVGHLRDRASDMGRRKEYPYPLKLMSFFLVSFCSNDDCSCSSLCMLFQLHYNSFFLFLIHLRKYSLTYGYAARMC